jgi:hypothetical protein
MSLIAARSAMVGGGAKLPYDAEVEYLESTGTQWIDTGYSYNSATDVVELVFEALTTSAAYSWVFGAYDTVKRLGLGVGSGTNRRTFGYNETTSYNSDTYYTSSSHEFLANQSGAGIDGIRFFNYSSFSTISNILLHTIPLDTTTYCSNSRIWSYKHYRNGVLMRYFQPVRFTNEFGQTEGAMYDRVSGQLFRNAGTGSFTIGADK